MTHSIITNSPFNACCYADKPTSAVLNNPQDERRNLPTPAIGEFALGLIICAINASISVGEVSYNSATLFGRSSTLEYCYDISKPKSESEILHGFISNLISNSEDLDGRIVEMVNEDFWNLI